MRGHYHLVVEDNGAGMSKDVQGNGLGLHLLDGFSKAIRGSIDSQGTTVAVRFEAPFEHELELHASSATIH